GSNLSVTGVKESGKDMVIKVGDLNADAVIQIGANKIVLKKLSHFSTGTGSIERKNGNEWVITDVSVGDLVLGEMHVENEDRSFLLDLKGEASFKGVKLLSGWAILRDTEGPKGEPTQELDELLIARLTVDEIASGAAKVELPNAKKDEQGSFEVKSAKFKNLVLANFDLKARRGTLKIGE